MNAHTLSRIADAITLERARAPYNDGRDQDGGPRRENLISGKGGPRPDLRGSGSRYQQERRRGGDVISHHESEAMKARLLKHAFVALIVVLMFIGWHFVDKWPY